MTLVAGQSLPYPASLMESHPVLPLVVASGDIDAHDNAVLNTYIRQYIRRERGDGGGVYSLPGTITNFYHFYIDVIVFVQLSLRKLLCGCS